MKNGQEIRFLGRGTCSGGCLDSMDLSRIPEQSAAHVAIILVSCFPATPWLHYMNPYLHKLYEIINMPTRILLYFPDYSDADSIDC